MVCVCQILDLLEHKAIFTAGYKAVLHIHSLVEECEISKLLAQVDPKTRERKKARPHAAAPPHVFCSLQHYACCLKWL